MKCCKKPTASASHKCGSEYRVDLHGLASQRVNDFLRVEVLRSVRVLLEEFTGPMAEQLMVGDLQFEGPAIPLVIKLYIIGVNEGELLICAVSDQYEQPVGELGERTYWAPWLLGCSTRLT